MYYEDPYRKSDRKNRRRKRPRRRSFGGWLLALVLRLLLLALTVAALTAGLLYVLPVSLFAVEPEGADLSLTGGLPQDRVNILLLGLDQQRENTRRSDSIIIATIGKGEVKLTSILRDTVMDIPGHGQNKLNAAYAYGGPELMIRTLNENLKLNLIHYVAVDYAGLIRMVDALGGVQLEITEDEMNRINNDINKNRQRYQARGYTAPDLSQYGPGTLLNGLQALSYARIRKLDSDFMRTKRQRNLISALLRRLRASLINPVRLFRLGSAILDSVETDLSPLQLVSLGEKALASGTPQQLRLPVDGSYDDNGSSLILTDPQKNVGELQMFLYGE